VACILLVRAVACLVCAHAWTVLGGKLVHKLEYNIKMNISGYRCQCGVESFDKE
jgi:hypothetical protein